jgi:hypothetical protein
MTGLSVGYWSPASELGDVDVFARRIRKICGPTNPAFPFAVSRVRDGKQTLLSYAVVRGHVPIHIDRPNAAESCSTIFTFVVTAENRPVVLYSPAGKPESECVFLGFEGPVKKMGFGAIELVQGRVIHFDIARSFHGITSFPSGDPAPAGPDAVLIQVPWADPRDIAGAVHRLRNVIARDERFSDLVQTGDGDENRGTDAQPG